MYPLGGMMLLQQRLPIAAFFGRIIFVRRTNCMGAMQH
jgi:hypothetical protein